MLADLESGKGAWTNIAQVVRQTFIAVFERIRTQSERIKLLERDTAAETRERKQEDERLAALIQTNTGGPSALLHERDQRIALLEREVRELRARLEELTSIIPRKDELQRVLARKVDIKTLESALQEFPDKQEISSSLRALHEDLDIRLTQMESKFDSEIRNALASPSQPTEDIEFLRSTVTSEMLLARWIWQGDRSGIIMWTETLNTSQLMFDSISDTGVRVLRKGMYEVSFGFFPLKDSAREAVIQLLVNDQLAIANDTGAHATPGTSQKGVRKSSNIKSVTGWSCCEYLAFSQDSEVILRYRGDKAKGFLSIKNLHCDVEDTIE